MEISRSPRIAVFRRKGSFSDGWIRYCQAQRYPIEIIDSISDESWQRILASDLFLWHWPHWDGASKKFAQSILNAAALAQKVVFPTHETAWHFDDKVAQKFALEAISAPFVAAHAFFSEDDAVRWMEDVKLPIVFKLRNGAGGSNVELVSSAARAYRLIKKSFGKGHPAVSRGHHLREAIRLLREGHKQQGVRKLAAGLINTVFPSFLSGGVPREQGYLYVQDFVEGNDSDIRVVVIGHRAFAIKRLVRPGDFRASGSGHINYEPANIPRGCIQIAFDVSGKLKTQCAAYDFVKTSSGWKIIEVSYGFSERAYLQCPGYWTHELTWISERVTPSEWIIEDAINLWAGSCKQTIDRAGPLS